MSEQVWEQRYQAGQTGWDRGENSPALLYWLEEGVLQPCRILVPGCGHGHEVVELARRGFDVTAVDIAPTPVSTLRQRLDKAGLKAPVVQANVLHWRPAAPFDAIYEQTCLCALSPDQWHDYENMLYEWLKPGGRLFALFMQTGAEGGPPYHCDLGDMRELFKPDRWRWPAEEDAREVPHSQGKRELGFVLARAE